MCEKFHPSVKQSTGHWLHAVWLSWKCYNNWCLFACFCFHSRYFVRFICWHVNSHLIAIDANEERTEIEDYTQHDQFHETLFQDDWSREVDSHFTRSLQGSSLQSIGKHMCHNCFTQCNMTLSLRLILIWSDLEPRLNECSSSIRSRTGKRFMLLEWQIGRTWDALKSVLLEHTEPDCDTFKIFLDRSISCWL